jgi:hypothetical protein
MATTGYILCADVSDQAHYSLWKRKLKLSTLSVGKKTFGRAAAAEVDKQLVQGS